METNSTKFVRFMNWFKKTYKFSTKDSSTKIVNNYLSPDEVEEPDPCYAHLDAEDVCLPLHYHSDGDGDATDDFGTGIGGQPMKPEERRYCKGCHADVTKSMYCHCGDFNLLKSETLSEEEIKKFQ